MNLLSRLALVFLFAGASLAGLIWLGHENALGEHENAIAALSRERSQRLQVAIALQGRGLESMTSSYAWWDDMVNFTTKPDEKWATTNIDNIVGIPGGGDAVWVIDPEFKLLHTINSTYQRPALPFPSADTLKRQIAGRYTFNYFTLIDGKLWQVFGAAIQDASFWRHETPVRGYLLLGKQWDDEWLAKLNTLVGARLSIVEPNAVPTPNVFRETMRGLDGGNVAVIEAAFNFQLIEDSHHAFDQQILIMSLGSVAALALVAGFLAFTILRPLSQISRSLESRVPTHLTSLLNSRSEFGEIARLVAGQLRWGRMLEEEMQRQFERAQPDRAQRDAEANEALRMRLASNIHDGPLQSIYAAGLQLAAIQTGAEEGLAPRTEQVAAINGMLQQASSDLRNLILDLEPVELREHDLETALQRIERHMKQFGRCAFTLEVRDNALDGLSRDAQTELYFVCRELTSNALRHARPNTASLRFSSLNGFLRIEWRNNGVTPRAATGASGNGLRNISRRIADLGGSVQSGPDGLEGWSVVCELPFTSILANAPRTSRVI